MKINLSAAETFKNSNVPPPQEDFWQEGCLQKFLGTCLQGIKAQTAEAEKK